MADRAFRQLLVLAFAAFLPLAVALALTLVPGAVQAALHRYDGLVQTCVAALYGVGQSLPPVGVPTLALAFMAMLAGGRRALALVLRTRALTARCAAVAPSPRIAAASARVGVGGRVTVFDSPVALAFTTGLARPHVYLSTAAVSELEPDELEAVVLHERAHLVRRDPLRIALARLLASALFFVPMAEALRRRFEVAKELDADREVVASQRQTAALAGALVKLGAAPALVTHELAVGAWSCTAARIDQLEGADVQAVVPPIPSRTRWLSALALALLLALALGQATRANIVPATALGLSALSVTATVHVCPLPLDGPLF